jgi:CheY-like chemotaxis protein
MAMDPPAITDDDVALQAAEALARVSAGAGHELANHLGAVRAFGAVLRLDEHVVGEYGLDTVDAVRDAGDEALQLVSSLLALVRRRPPAPGPVPLATAVTAALRLVSADTRGTVTVAVDVPEDLPDVQADPARLHQALVALLVNALDALGHPRATGRLAITARSSADAPTTAGDPAPPVELWVTDDGPPVPPADVPHLFDPRPPAGGTGRAGLDLAVARHLVGLDGGSLRYERAADGTNALVLALVPVAPSPVAPSPVTAPGNTASPDAAAPDPVTVLVCDDDPTVREVVVRLLGRAGIRALAARSGAETLAILEQRRVDAILADSLMAGMSGPELHAAVAARHPRLRRRFVFLSGDPENAGLVAFAREQGLRILPKPFDASALVAAIREVASG